MTSQKPGHDSLSAIELLRKYWKHESFRQCQAEIIDSVTHGHDTMGLLPTGGGKSVTFQIPALMLPGITIVVTPLISLMKDQIDNLADIGIRAVAIHSGLTRAEQKLAFDRARLGRVKILYLSPEKLQSQQFVELMATSVNVSLIVVDEAHCISQWGYDFRPSYLRLAQLRKHFPNATVLALTASATPDVATDIMDKLQFRERRVFSRSFTRPNISYIVRHTQHKQHMLLKVLNGTKGTAIVYTRSRRRCVEYAQFLRDNGISANYYHAGLSPEEKELRQNLWKEDRLRVMVATTAFGMGIDKPDVRVVVHVDAPSSLEEYYQEAGRAGRDGMPSFAVMITSTHDKTTLTTRLNQAYPDKDVIRNVYEHTCNFLDIAVGSGYNQIFEFNQSLFCERFKLKASVVKSSLKLLTQAGYLDYIDEISTRSRVFMTVDRRELYQYQLSPVTESVLTTMLRMYTGVFADYVHIVEESIATKCNLTPNQVYESMLQLSRLHILTYVPRRSTPYIILTTSRELPKHVQLPRTVYEDMRQRMKQRIDSVKEFLYNDSRCRVNTLLSYFGKSEADTCGTCDVCRAKARINASKEEKVEKSFRESIIYLAQQPRPTSIDYIAFQLEVKPSDLTMLLRQMMDEGIIQIDSSMLVTLKISK